MDIAATFVEDALKDITAKVKNAREKKETKLTYVVPEIFAMEHAINTLVERAETSLGIKVIKVDYDWTTSETMEFYVLTIEL